MGLEIVILSEIGQRMTSIIMLSTYLPSQSRNDTNGLITQNRNRLIDIESEL